MTVDRYADESPDAARCVVGHVISLCVVHDVASDTPLGCHLLDDPV